MGSKGKVVKKKLAPHKDFSPSAPPCVCTKDLSPLAPNDGQGSGDGQGPNSGTPLPLLSLFLVETKEKLGSE